MRPSLPKPGTVLLTPTRRMARHLQARDEQTRRARGLEVWEPPEILPWSAWLQHLWDEALPLDAARPTLLTPVQEQCLWQRVLEDSPEGDTLLNPAATARAAAEAWRLLQDHCLALDPTDLFLDDDSRAFAGWAEEFRWRCARARWLDPARLSEALEGRLGEALLPEAVVLRGFDEVPPRQQRLLKALRKAGCRVAVPDDEAPPGRFVRAAFAGPEEEARAAARWARRILLARPEARVALVVPDLAGQRALLERTLEDVLQPDAVLPRNHQAPRLFNLSLGRPLAHHAPVHDALLLLKLVGGPLPLDEAGEVVRSPHLAGAREEAGPRGLLDAALRRRLVPSAGLDRVLRFARAADAQGQPRPHACPLLVERLERVREAARALPERQSPARWAEDFDHLLSLAGWPGDRPDSDLMQTVLRWRETLAGLRQVEGIWPAMTFRRALEQVRDLALAAVFQPRGPEAPVQVLGVLEAAGLDFDEAWLLGLHDEAWPAGARPNPFLPLDLQRRAGMPHSSPARELAFARRVTRRLLASAPHGVASWAEREGDREMRPSSLIRSLPEENPAEAAVPAWRELLFASRAVEEAPDRPPPPLPPGTAARGGSRLFKLQAACPFRAFAELRLGAEPLEPLQSGLSPRERGTLLHAALEHAWKHLESHHRLCAAAPEELAEVVGQAAEHAVAGLAAERPDVLAGRFRELERDRLARLVTDWLDLERERSPFRVVRSEQGLRLEMAGLEFEAQIDRLDRLEDGSLAVLDYKTGRPSVKDWLGDRPEEPQLPLYCTAAGVRPAAVAFAQVRPGEMALKGVAAGPGVHPQIPPLERSDLALEAGSWDELLDRWRAVLGSLAAQFREGYAPVDPKARETCRHCSQQPLCRIHEVAANA